MATVPKAKLVGSAQILPQYVHSQGSKCVRDPVHCYIALPGEVMAVVDLPVFQRLRRIHQMSFADLVYPGCQHSRFSHSLGVTHLANRLGQYLLSANYVNERTARLLLWAGLLHDIGHFPFSHAFEPALQKFYFSVREGKSPNGKETKWSGAHERFGTQLIRSNATIAKAIGSADDVAAVGAIITGELNGQGLHANLMKAVVKEHFCIDKLDYIRRDALHAGTPEYAAIDTDRLLTSFLVSGADVYHRPRAQFALEAMVLSYYYMYRAVYFHKTIRAAYCLFQSVLWEAFERGVFAKINLEDPSFWVSWDDAQCLRMIGGYGNEELCRRLSALVERRLPKVILDDEDFRGHDDVRQRVAEFCSPDTVTFERRLAAERDLRETLGVDEFFIDSPGLSPYPQPGALKFPLIADNEAEPHRGAQQLHVRAKHLAELVQHTTVARVYMTRKWNDNKEKDKIKTKVLEAIWKRLSEENR